jgi:hypothetical protein
MCLIISIASFRYWYQCALHSCFVTPAILPSNEFAERLARLARTPRLGIIAWLLHPHKRLKKKSLPGDFDATQVYALGGEKE